MSTVIDRVAGGKLEFIEEILSGNVDEKRCGIVKTNFSLVEKGSH
jgi:hypothetical protein